MRRERSLWRLAAVPFLLSLAAVLLALGIVFGFAGEIYAFVTGWLPALDAGTWYAWFWIAPAKLLLWLLGLVLFVVLVGAVLVACVVVASLLASPFLDVLSRRVEEIVAGGVTEVQPQGWAATLRDAARAIGEEARRTVFFLAVQIGLLGLGVVVPGGQLVAPPAMTLFTVLFLPLDYSSYALDRRRLGFRDKRRWIFAHPPLMLGYGSAAFLTCLAPGLNLLAMPILVVAGTLLVLRHPPAPAGSLTPEPGRGDGPGRSTSP